MYAVHFYSAHPNAVGVAMYRWGAEQFVSLCMCVVEAAAPQALQNTAVSERASETNPGFNSDLQQESEAVFDADSLWLQIRINLFTGAQGMASQ